MEILHNEELHNLYLHKSYQGDQIKKDWMGGTCSTHERELRNENEIFSWKTLTKT
jgi:hypothetical protein